MVTGKSNRILLEKTTNDLNDRSVTCLPARSLPVNELPNIDHVLSTDSEPSLISSVKRRCIGCRASVSQTSLLRVFDIISNSVEPNSFRVLSGRASISHQETGRSIYFHPNSECIDKGVHPKALSRAYRKKVSQVRADQLREQLQTTRQSLGMKAANDETDIETDSFRMTPPSSKARLSQMTDYMIRQGK